MSKYHSKKVKVNGVTYASEKEYERYKNLLFLEKSGIIKNLQYQVKYELCPARRKSDGKIERSLNYIADFVYEMDGETVVEDVKGVKTQLYIAKRKMMLYRYGIEITET